MCVRACVIAPICVCAWVAKVQIDAKINYEHVVRIGMRLTWCEPVTWPCWAAALRLWCRWTINPHPHVWHRADEASAWSVTGRQRRISVTMKTDAPPPQEREQHFLPCRPLLCNPDIVALIVVLACLLVWGKHQISLFQPSTNKNKFATGLFL